MPNLTLLGWLFVAWSTVSIALTMVLIYRSIVSMKEDDQLFLDAAESHFEKEQQGILLRLDGLRPYVKGLAIMSGSLLASMVGLIAYRVISVL
jgi:hypothetical protein